MLLHQRLPRAALAFGRMRGAARPRHLVAALVLSAAGFIGIASQEGYTEKAIVPTQGDRPTLGFGSTFHEDGSPIKLGEATSPVRALVKAQAHISQEEDKFRASLPGVMLSQVEYDVYMDFVYQYGTSAWSKSSIRKHLLAGRYESACKALLLYKFSAGYDCSTPGNKRCAGVWTRQQQRHAQCMTAIQAVG